mgnify:CR=1 FL=1
MTGPPPLKVWPELTAPDVLACSACQVKSPLVETRIAVVGKYVELKDSYKSLVEALAHGRALVATSHGARSLESQASARRSRSRP